MTFAMIYFISRLIHVTILVVVSCSNISVIILFFNFFTNARKNGSNK